MKQRFTLRDPLMWPARQDGPDSELKNRRKNQRRAVNKAARASRKAQRRRAKR